MAAKKQAASLQLKNRITGMRFIKGADLQDNAGNWRTHPQSQRDALSGVLREIGIAGALLVYQSERQGGLAVIDGHLRKDQYPEQEWPCLMTDLTDDEADYMLLVHDPIAALAEADTETLRRLMESVNSSEAAVQALISKMAEGFSPIAPHVEFTEYDESVEAEVKWHECPECGHRWPK